MKLIKQIQKKSDLFRSFSIKTKLALILGFTIIFISASFLANLVFQTKNLPKLKLPFINQQDKEVVAQNVEEEINPCIVPGFKLRSKVTPPFQYSTIFTGIGLNPDNSVKGEADFGPENRYVCIGELKDEMAPPNISQSRTIFGNVSVNKKEGGNTNYYPENSYYDYFRGDNEPRNSCAYGYPKDLVFPGKSTDYLGRPTKNTDLCVSFSDFRLKSTCETFYNQAKCDGNDEDLCLITGWRDENGYCTTFSKYSSEIKQGTPESDLPITPCTFFHGPSPYTNIPSSWRGTKPFSSSTFIASNSTPIFPKTIPIDNLCVIPSINNECPSGGNIWISSGICLTTADYIPDCNIVEKNISNINLQKSVGCGCPVTQFISIDGDSCVQSESVCFQSVAINPPECDKCPVYELDGDSCVHTCSFNYAINPPECNICADGSTRNVQFRNDGSNSGDQRFCATPVCYHGLIEYPECNKCPFGQVVYEYSCKGVCKINSTTMGVTKIAFDFNFDQYRRRCVGLDPCQNGAINFPSCNFCADGLALVGGLCIDICTNGATNPPDCNQIQLCLNGAINQPECNVCPNGQTLVDNQCATACANGATNPPECDELPVCSNRASNPPECNTCPANSYLDNNTNSCFVCPGGARAASGSNSITQCRCPIPTQNLIDGFCICPFGQGVKNNQCVDNEPTIVLFTPLAATSFDPAKNSPETFGNAPLKIQVFDTNRTTISNSARCTIEYRKFGSNDAYTSQGLTNIDNTYDNNNGCSATLPPNQQQHSAYEFRARITDPNVLVNGTPQAYDIETGYRMNVGLINQVINN